MSLNDKDTFWHNIELYDAATPKQRARAAKVLLGRIFAPRDCGHSTESMAMLYLTYHEVSSYHALHAPCSGMGGANA